jgi:putative hydrolase of the HAD superfamily
VTTIRHVFFDIGGVLGSNGWDREQRSRAVQHFGLSADDFQCRHEEVVGEWEEGKITMDEYLDIAVFHTSREFSRRQFVDYMFAQSVPHEPVVRLARALTRDSRFTLMTLNNEADELNRHRIDKFGISDVFEAFLSSCWLGARKPTRRFFARAIGVAQADPSSSLFIDDREQNLAPAHALGMVPILFESPEQLRSDLERVLHLELSGA